MIDEALEEALVACGMLAHGDSNVDEYPSVLQDPLVLQRFPIFELGYQPIEGNRYPILSCRSGRGTEVDLPVLPKVI